MPTPTTTNEVPIAEKRSNGFGENLLEASSQPAREMQNVFLNIILTLVWQLGQDLPAISNVSQNNFYLTNISLLTRIRKVQTKGKYKENLEQKINFYLLYETVD